MSHPKKLEGDALMKEGASCLATGFFKWTPDVDGAVRAYGKAATCYKAAREHELAKAAFLAEATNQQRSNMMFGAARAFENAGLMAKELGQLEEAASHLETAARCFEQVDFQKAADTLALAASMLPPEASAKKIELLSLACDRLEAEDRAGTLDPFRALVSAYLSINNYQLAIETIERLMPYYQELKQPHNVHKSCRDIVIIHMCSKGPADAEQAWYQFATEHQNFGRSSEGLFCTKLLDLVKYGTQEELAKCIEYEMCSIRIPEVARLLHRLQPLGLTRPSDDLFGSAPAFGDGPAAPDDDDDDPAVVADEEDDGC